MATKKAAAKPAKAAVKKAAAKKPARPVGKKKEVKKGDRYSCEVCGLLVSVDEACGCVDTCDIVCCGKQMKAKK